MIRQRHLLVSLALAVLLVGCNDGSSSPTEPGPPLVQAGNWVGTTDQGLPIAFTVSGVGASQVISAFEVTMQFDVDVPVSEGGCLGVLFFQAGFGGSPTNVPIENNTFKIEVPGNANLFVPDTTMEMDGNFTSSVAANGTLVMQTPATLLDCIVRGEAEWTATPE